MSTLYFSLLLAAAVCLFLATLSVTVHKRISLLALGLLLWVCVPLVQQAKRL